MHVFQWVISLENQSSDMMMCNWNWVSKINNKQGSTTYCITSNHSASIAVNFQPVHYWHGKPLTSCSPGSINNVGDMPSIAFTSNLCVLNPRKWCGFYNNQPPWICGLPRGWYELHMCRCTHYSHGQTLLPCMYFYNVQQCFVFAMYICNIFCFSSSRLIHKKLPPMLICWLFFRINFMMPKKAINT